MDKVKENNSNINLNIIFLIIITRLIYFNPLIIFRNFVASNIFKRVYFRLGYFVNKFSEIFETYVQLLFVQSNSGWYTYIILDHNNKDGGNDGDDNRRRLTIFLSD